MKKTLVIIFLITFVLNSYSQIGGTATYKFLDLPTSARVSALGGNNISIADDDLNLVYNNPALLDSSMANTLTMSYVNYFADINWGYASYAFKTKKLGTIAAGMHYVDYGKFTGADEFGNKNGDFYASEYALNIFWAYQIDSFWTAGVNFKPILSVLESYNSFGLAFDFGINYNRPEKGFSAAFVIKNLGSQIKPYYGKNYEPLPFDLQVGMTKKLAHAPFRFSLLAQHLQKPNLNYTIPENENIVQFDSQTATKENIALKYSDMAMRHLIIGLEFMPAKAFTANIGYNHQRRQELRLTNKAGFSGFSYGIGINLKKFYIGYGRANYHLAGASNNFSVRINFNEFYNKKN